MPRFTSILLGAALLCVLPFLVLAFYSQPSLDDFTISTLLRATDVLSYTWDIYHLHSGRFASCLFSALHLVFLAHMGWYPYLIFGLLSTFALSLYGAAAALIPGSASGQRLAGSVVLIVGFAFFPWPAEGMFWLTGAVAYLLPLTLTGCLVMLLAQCYAAPTGRAARGAWLLSAVLGFFIVGFSEITALLALLVVAALVGLPRLRPRCREAYWVVGALVVGALLTLGAPGNFLRLSKHGGTIRLLHSGVTAAAATAYLLLNWLGNATLLVLTALLLPLSQAVARGPARSLLNRLAGPAWLWPLLLLGGLFGSVWFCYLVQKPEVGPALRVKNILYFYFLVGWLLSVHAAVRQYSRRPLGYPTAKIAYGLGGVLLACVFFSDHNTTLTHASIGRASNTVVQAYRDWLGGDAARYQATLQARYRQLSATRQDSVRVPELAVRPLTLFNVDISYNPDLWGNQSYARFFGKKATWTYPVAPPPAGR